MVTEFSLADAEEMSRLRLVERTQESDFIEVLGRMQEALVAVLVAVIASFAVAQSRRLVFENVRAERARENLARYFSPEVAAELASDEHDLGAARRQDAAVLFADIVGFTRLSESLGPEGTIALLREWHGRLGDIVFRHGGTLDKYMGDGLMATFGAPRVRPDDASRALAAALEMAAAARRPRAGAGPGAAAGAGPQASPDAPPGAEASGRSGGSPSIRIGVGLHFGPVVLGNVGNERRLEFAVLGDTVNVASRLEGLTRELDVGPRRLRGPRGPGAGGGRPGRAPRVRRRAEPPGPFRAGRGVRARGPLNTGAVCDRPSPRSTDVPGETALAGAETLPAGAEPGSSLRLERHYRTEEPRSTGVRGESWGTAGGGSTSARGARPPIDAASGSASGEAPPPAGVGTGVSNA